MEKVYSGVEMVPARRLKLQGQGVHICTMPLYTKTTSHSGNNIGIYLLRDIAIPPIFTCIDIHFEEKHEG